MTGIDFSQFAEKYYEMNQETDDILPSGRQLRDGMVVLIEEPTFRKDIETLRAYAEHKAPGWEELLAEAKMRNRWAKVSYIFFTKDQDVSFIGEFPDGIKRQVRMGLDFAWLVKKDSLPQNKPTIISGVADAPEYLKDPFKSVVEEAQESVVRWRDWKAQQRIVDAEAEMVDPKKNATIPNQKAWIPSQDGRGLVKASNNPDIEFTPMSPQDQMKTLDMIHQLQDDAGYAWRKAEADRIQEIFGAMPPQMASLERELYERSVDQYLADRKAAMGEMNDRLGGPEYFEQIQNQMHAIQKDVIAEVLTGDFEPKLSPDNPYAEIEKQMLAAWKRDRLEIGLHPHNPEED